LQSVSSHYVHLIFCSQLRLFPYVRIYHPTHSSHIVSLFSPILDTSISNMTSIKNDVSHKEHVSSSSRWAMATSLKTNSFYSSDFHSSASCVTSSILSNVHTATIVRMNSLLIPISICLQLCAFGYCNNY
jgi:hypothetical protein